MQTIREANSHKNLFFSHDEIEVIRPFYISLGQAIMEPNGTAYLIMARLQATMKGSWKARDAHPAMSQEFPNSLETYERFHQCPRRFPYNHKKVKNLGSLEDAWLYLCYFILLLLNQDPKKNYLFAHDEFEVIRSFYICLGHAIREPNGTSYLIIQLSR